MWVADETRTIEDDPSRNIFTHNRHRRDQRRFAAVFVPDGTEAEPERAAVTEVAGDEEGGTHSWARPFIQRLVVPK